jgi:cytochrome P450
MDPDIYPDSETFNGYRFINPETGSCDVRNTTTPTQTWLPFAIGSLTCPGRLVGIRVCQVIVAKMILDYDMHLFNKNNSPLLLHSVGVAVPNPEIEMRVKGRQTNSEKAGILR